jgi:hypothetical protein
MGEEQRVVVARRFRGRAEAAQLVAEFEASGVSRREFCESHGLAVSTLDAYRKRQRHPDAEAAAAGGRWMAVDLSASRRADEAAPSGLKLALPGGRRIEIGRGFDAETLRRLIAAMEQI